MSEILMRNEWLLFVLSNCLKEGVLSKFINQVMDESIEKMPILFSSKKVGLLQIKREDAVPLRNNVGSFSLLASKIPDNISGTLHQESTIKINHPYKASFVIINPKQIIKKRVITLKIIKESE